MARKQSPVGFPTKTVAAAGTPEALVATSTLCKSFIVTALVTNTDYVFIGDSANQNQPLEPGMSLEVNGDGLDLGTDGYLDLIEWYVRVSANGEGVSFMILNNQ